MVRLSGVQKSEHGSPGGKRKADAELLAIVAPRGLLARRARGFALVMGIAAALVLLVDSNSAVFADYADGVRTEQAMTLPDAVKVWRREAWQRDDFLAQIRLGDLY